MENKELLEELNALEKELADLPVGYISRKTIYGKKKCYHQWMEDGKKKSKYVDDATAESLQNDFSRRRELQDRIKQIKAVIQTSKKEEIKWQKKYNTIVSTGIELKDNLKDISKFKYRELLPRIEEYLYGEIVPRVFILYGLRRTGKTTMMKQVIAKMSDNDFDKTAYIQVRTGDELSLLYDDMDALRSEGYKYIFIDEVTLLEDFIEGAALFADIYAASGIKVVLSGTDSLGFVFSRSNQLYDRCIMLHTTYIPYKEFENVLGKKGIDEYIRYGGTMSLGGVYYNTERPFENKASSDQYIDGAIANNIQHSLQYYQDGRHFRALEELYEKNELTGAINRIIEDMNHKFTIEVLTRDFVSHDLGVSKRNLRFDKDHPSDILNKVDKEQVTAKLMELLEIKNKKDQKVNITQTHCEEIKEYLELLDLIVDVDIRLMPPASERIKRTIFTQPGMRYSQATGLIQSLMEDTTFDTLPYSEKTRVVNRILDEIRGRMMEDIVLLETKLAYPRKRVFKLEFAVGEFDMVVADSETMESEIFEIKYSKEALKEQAKNLLDENKCNVTEYSFGKIVRKTVIYRGETTEIDGILYQNVEEYLKQL
ncbi:MAG: AAA family ATPase [Clostridiales bacterium]|nr:AAA family ATPase [Clostridiales bacterium]